MRIAFISNVFSVDRKTANSRDYNIKTGEIYINEHYALYDYLSMQAEVAKASSLDEFLRVHGDLNEYDGLIYHFGVGGQQQAGYIRDHYEDLKIILLCGSNAKDKYDKFMKGSADIGNHPIGIYEEGNILVCPPEIYYTFNILRHLEKNQ